MSPVGGVGGCRSALAPPVGTVLLGAMVGDAAGATVMAGRIAGACGVLTKAAEGVMAGRGTWRAATGAGVLTVGPVGPVA